MLFASVFTSALCLAGISARAPFWHPSGIPIKVKSLQGRAVAPANNIWNKPSRVQMLQARAIPDPGMGPSRTVVPANHVSQSNRMLGLTTKIHSIVSKCRNRVAPHVQKIKHHCRKRETQNVITASILVELEAIFVIIKATLVEIKTCGNAPTPSGVPTTQHISVTEVAHILLDIIVLIKVAVTEISQFLDEESAQQHFSQILFSITGATSELLVQVNIHLHTSLAVLAQVGGKDLSTIQSFGFGFGSILEVVQRFSAV